MVVVGHRHTHKVKYKDNSVIIASKRYVDRLIKHEPEHPRRLESFYKKITANFDLTEIASTSCHVVWFATGNTTGGAAWFFGREDGDSYSYEIGDTGFSLGVTSSGGVNWTGIDISGINKSFYIFLQIIDTDSGEYYNVYFNTTLLESDGADTEYFPLWYVPWDSTYSQIDKENIIDMRHNYHLGFIKEGIRDQDFAAADNNTITITHGLITAITPNSTGATGTFQDKNGNTITVANGLITALT